MEKKGQLTIFIIVAILIVSAVLIFFLWARPTFFEEGGKRIGFEGCVADAVENAIDELSETIGFVDAEFTYLYEGNEIPYVCYTGMYYETCTVQVPFLEKHFEEGIKRRIRGEVDACYEASLESLRAEGYEVSGGEVSYDVVLNPGVVKVNIRAPTVAGSESFERFGVSFSSAIYEELMIATSILQYESEFGDADVSSMMFLYPDYIISKNKRSDGTTVYSIREKGSENKLRFASRSLAWPAGYLR